MQENSAPKKARAPSVIRFAAPLRTIGRSTIVTLPADESAKLPSRGQVAVKGVINRQKFQTVLEPDGRRGHWFKIEGRLRHALPVSDGATVTVEIEPTRDWPEPRIPKDFQVALAAAPDISEIWRGITPMARWEWVRWINATKNPATRERRVQVGVSKLRSGKRRPCCFDLAACTDPDLAKNGKLMDVV
jgi:Bacteriocin-protection, YdeI or OmpD-Associated/Domain of unknown function (DUF1905)